MKPTARRTIRPTITSWFISPSVSVTTTEAFTALSSRGKRNSSKGSCDFPPRLATKNNTPPSIPGHHTDVRTCSLVATKVHISKQFQRNALEGLVSKRRPLVLVWPVKVRGEGEGPETPRHDGEVFAGSNGARLLFGVCCVRDTQVCLEHVNPYRLRDEAESGDEHMMSKKLWLSVVGLAALGLGAPASAADLAGEKPKGVNFRCRRECRID